MRRLRAQDYRSSQEIILYFWLARGGDIPHPFFMAETKEPAEETSGDNNPGKPPVKKKTGTSADQVSFEADISEQLKQLRSDFNEKNKTDAEKLKALPDLNTKIDQLFQGRQVQQEKKKGLLDDLFGNFWDGFFD
jgi:hypothetical protein